MTPRFITRWNWVVFWVLLLLWIGSALWFGIAYDGPVCDDFRPRGC